MGIHEERKSVFEAFSNQAWPYAYHVEMLISELHGGTPRNPDVVRNWLMAKAGYKDEDEIQAELDRIFAVDQIEDEEEPPMTGEQVAEKATKKIADRQVNGFKPLVRDGSEELFMEGRHLRAMLVEAISIARAANKLDKLYGATNKGIISFAKEHIFVPAEKLYLGKKEHDALVTRFVPTWRGTGITVEEVVYDVTISTTVKTDYLFTEEEWAMIWLTAEKQSGIGASRSQGYGRFITTAWDRIEEPKKPVSRRKKT
jgi:hypothetical protein